jgi:Sulfotransferase family
VDNITHAEAPVKVLYILGAGRSGSTILDIVVGNHPDLQSTGELANLVRTGWVGGDTLGGIERRRLRIPICTCGKRLDIPEIEDPAEACPFWSSVRREWVRRVGPRDDIESYPALQDEFEKFTRWPRLLRERLRPSPRFQSYARLTRAFFESIRAVSGKPVIVDSTKAPSRAFALSMVPGIDLRVAHLVRDARGVMSSRRKTLRKDVEAGIEWTQESRPIWETAVVWVLFNLISEWVCVQVGADRAVRLRHEDLYEDTGGELDKIGLLTESDLRGVAAAASSGKTMQVGHNIGGNRMRKSESVTLKPDPQEWRSALSASEQRLSWALMGWLMRRYGYKR